MKKRIIALALAFAMVFCLCSCGGGKDNGGKDQPETVKVNFNTDGGSVIGSMEIKKGSTVIKPEAPVKEGFTFEKWTLNGSDFDFASAVDSDITLLAVWKAKDDGNKGGEENNNQGQKPDENNQDQKPDENNQGQKPDENNQGQKPDENNQEQKPEDKPVVCESIKFDNNWYWIQINTETDVPFTIVPESCRDKVTYTSSDEKIASVDKNGIVHGNKSGKITLTAKCGDKTATIPVEIRAFSEGITLNMHEADIGYMGDGSSFDLVATLTPEYVVDSTVTFTSSNTSVAKVDANGHVQGVLPGYAIVTATDAAGHTDTCDVFVNGAYIEATITGKTDLAKGESTTFIVTFVKFAHGLSSSYPCANCVEVLGNGEGFVTVTGDSTAEQGILKCFNSLETPGSVGFVFMYNNEASQYCGMTSNGLDIKLH